MMSSKLKWLIVIQLLLNEQALCRVPPPLSQRNALLLGTGSHEEAEEMPKRDHQSFLGSRLQLGLSSAEKTGPVSADAQKEERARSAEHVISGLRVKLQGQIRDHLRIQGNVSCEELLSASTVDDPLSSMFPQELLGLSLVPVLVVAGCPKEAQTLVLKLYDLLGVRDTEELLMEVESLIERRMRKSASTPAPPSAASSSERDQAGPHIEAVMFNIQQLVMVGEETSTQEGHCEGWTRVNGTTLVGTAVEGATGGLEEAVNSCERLGVLCAGVTSSGLLTPGTYRAVLKKGSRVLPSDSSGCECWIRQCSAEEDVSIPTASGRRMRRSTQRSCINKSEERVYSVVEWIPAVSTLYNLGTAVYYASVNCSETAKERAILSAVDLGTDALMVATGGTAGVAGYALGAGVKTGVKAGVRYLLNSMKQEDDVLVNQFSWEEGVITIQ
ncbi:apolipoprotein F [Lates japonicus]|uniref:Apolipoprotein F n=1 Tax=Lates japonicus TaxID=270547 RepID=A0AAD3RJS9_LATJO|nr:apolipoprotein F [Lates japonicus]GLD71766.1 apolipoprotein F [Lates japonicus]